MSAVDPRMLWLRQKIPKELVCDITVKGIASGYQEHFGLETGTLTPS